MSLCNCEDFPCCGCGQEWLTVGRFDDPFDEDQNYWDMREAYWHARIDTDDNEEDCYV